MPHALKQVFYGCFLHCFIYSYTISLQKNQSHLKTQAEYNVLTSEQRLSSDTYMHLNCFKWSNKWGQGNIFIGEAKTNVLIGRRKIKDRKYKTPVPGGSLKTQLQRETVYCKTRSILEVLKNKQKKRRKLLFRRNETIFVPEPGKKVLPQTE